MANRVRHFSINANDLPRARRFYEKTFGWKFEPYGPPDFYMIDFGDKDSDLLGSLQRRREIVPGKPMIGFECTIAVTDVDRVAKAVQANGGRILMEKTALAGIGDLIFFEDSEGNVAGAMRYDDTVE